ncbi:hypothetical protein AX16_003760 [Volvariella volvacea WC 439]|nr:hypothetical protein AX16_003760 [Volvariella volvacea WC 439]
MPALPCARASLLQLASDLDNSSDPDLAFLRSSTDAVAVLSSAACDLLACNISTTLPTRLDFLISVSVEQLTKASPGTNVRPWRRLHTDASILRSFFNLDSNTAKPAIQLLDHAIIISGAADYLRLDIIHQVIHEIQRTFFPDFTPFQARQLSQIPLIDSIIKLDTAHRPILSLDHPPSLSAFQSTFCAQPFILRGYARHWPAFNEHPWRSSHYLRSVAGPCRSVPVEVGHDYRTNDWTQCFMDWDAFLDTLSFSDQPEPKSQNEIHYLAQHSLFMQFPALQSDVVIPDYAYAYIDPSTFVDYQPPQNPEGVVCNAWLGPRGTTSPAHTDPFLNLFVQVVGRKTVWIAPPDVTRMYPYNESRAAKPAASTSLSNTSQVDVFSNENTGDFEGFWKEVTPIAQSATLSPGDLLYLPPRWWHAMRSEETSFSLSFWF